jgi:hypothetical protein
MRQDVSLVDEDYYERGVDFTEEMNVSRRSEPYTDSIRAVQEGVYLHVDFPALLVPAIDSGTILLYRPSNQSLDVSQSLDFKGNRISIQKSDLYLGRYILKLEWYNDGLKYEVDQLVHIQ